MWYLYGSLVLLAIQLAVIGYSPSFVEDLTDDGDDSGAPFFIALVISVTWPALLLAIPYFIGVGIRLLVRYTSTKEN